jgi:choline dehydrogenase-like flavoprotein
VDDTAVVATGLSVTGLRVADASVMPTITNATVLAIAERAADLIAGRNDR